MASASVFYYWKYGGERTTSSNDPADLQLDTSTASAIRRRRLWQMSVEDLTNRIGELPSSLRRRSGRWPWDRPRTTVKEEEERIPEADLKLVDDPPEQSQQENRAQKSSLCIGSIFGLDVGGTLAKLAYFESNELMAAASEEGHAERLYRASASAQAVCMARRSGGSDQQQNNASLNHHFSFHGETVQQQRTNGTVDSDDDPPPPPRRRQRSKSHNSSSKLWAPLIVTESLHEPARTRILKHSDSSNVDLQNLARLRQESVPDDLNAFADASGYVADNLLFPNNMTSTSNGSNRHLGKEPESNDQTDNNSGKQPSMRKVRSMFDLSSSNSSDHEEALNRFCEYFVGVTLSYQ